MEENYRIIFFEALDAVINAITDRFQQPSYQVFVSIEQLLLNAINGEPFDEYLKQLSLKYSDDFNQSDIRAELQILRTIFIDSNAVYFDDVVGILKALPKEEFSLLENFRSIVKIALVGAATSATPERSFSMARKIKTYTRSTMTQKRLNSLSVLSTYKDSLDNLSIVDVANSFVDNKPDRFDKFGKFTNEDLY